MNCVLKQEFQLACSTAPEKKKERDFSVTIQILRHSWVHICEQVLHSIFLMWMWAFNSYILSLPFHAGFVPYPACPAWKISWPAVHESTVHLFLVFSWKAKYVEHHSAFRCWDTWYILMFWHEQSVEIYFFHCTGNKSALSENYCSSYCSPFVSDIYSPYTVVICS